MRVANMQVTRDKGDSTEANWNVNSMYTNKISLQR